MIEEHKEKEIIRNTELHLQLYNNSLKNELNDVYKQVNQMKTEFDSLSQNLWNALYKLKKSENKLTTTLNRVCSLEISKRIRFRELRDAYETIELLQHEVNIKQSNTKNESESKPLEDKEGSIITTRNM